MAASIVSFAPDDSNLEILKNAFGEDVGIEWVDSNQDLDSAAEALKNTVAIILPGNRVTVPVKLAEKCPNLKLIQTISAGTDYLDKTSLGELGIKVSNNGGGNAVSVAEHTIALIVGVYRKMQLQYINVQNGKWQGNVRSEWGFQSHELTGKTVGIVGLGRIGSELAKRLQGWDCDVIYSDVVSEDPPIAKELNIRRVSIDEIIEKSDIITLHVPLNSQTRGMISDDQFDRMKPTSVLINACRGAVVDEAALIRAMESNKIMAAGLDVLEKEPTPENNPLIDYENVLITPHLAGFSQEAYTKSHAFAVRNSLKVSSGEAPDSVVLPDD
tara:strand:- start:596 stop:1579 length:984 start_codon:yes stop_codon:yes gene_type:complete